MKQMNFFYSLLFTCLSCSCWAQQGQVDQINKLVNTNETRAHVEFLAADEMKGRDVGSPELEIAGNYIASAFSRYGVKPVKGQNYFQPVVFLKIIPPTQGELNIASSTFTFNEQLAHINGGDIDWKGDVIFLNYGTESDFANTDVKGKVVITFAGLPGENEFAKAIFADAPNKNSLAKAKGAAALLEIPLHPGIPFTSLVRYSQRVKMKASEENPLPHLFLQAPSDDLVKQLKDKTPLSGSLNIKGSSSTTVVSRNVAGVIEGTDPILKKEFLVITAHYDHIGVGTKNAANDSIFNGARDNALGTTAFLSAAKYLGANAPKRSVLFVAFTAEEKGLLGSAWYVNHPVIPLDQCVFNLNADGGGYNDKTAVVFNGLEYLNTDKELKSACTPFGVTGNMDPVPERNLYASSDNYSFAEKGIPAVNLAPGFKGFDDEIMKYYHQQEDEADSIDFDYVIRYFKSFTNCAVTIANMAKAPGWKSGVKYEKNKVNQK